jgi:hypothetical protein
MLERRRAAPAEGVHSDEVWHALAYPNLENAQIVASAAVILVILHLAPSPWSELTHPREAECRSVRSVSEKRCRGLCSFESSIARNKSMRERIQVTGTFAEDFRFYWWS